MSERDTFLARWSRLKQEAGKAETPAAPFDPANLPPIESLTSESDVSVFLQSGVPTDMVRAALHSAWRVDPAIRDFIGIAESQWDFNDPNAMPGFGPLDPMIDAQSVVTHSVPPNPASGEAFLEAPPDRNPQRDGQLDKVWLSGEPSHEGPAQVGPTDREMRSDLVSTDTEAPGAARRHGSALPKPS